MKVGTEIEEKNSLTIFKVLDLLQFFNKPRHVSQNTRRASKNPHICFLANISVLQGNLVQDIENCSVCKYDTNNMTNKVWKA